jgi:hypothetical protein
MAILCWAAKNSVRGTLPRCTAGVAEPVLCSSRCRFLTSCLKLFLPRLREGWLLQLLLGWDHHPLASIPCRGVPLDPHDQPRDDHHNNRQYHPVIQV